MRQLKLLTLHSYLAGHRVQTAIPTSTQTGTSFKTNFGPFLLNLYLRKHQNKLNCSLCKKWKKERKKKSRQSGMASILNDDIILFWCLEDCREKKALGFRFHVIEIFLNSKYRWQDFKNYFLQRKFNISKFSPEFDVWGWWWQNMFAKVKSIFTSIIEFP